MNNNPLILGTLGTASAEGFTLRRASDMLAAAVRQPFELGTPSVLQIISARHYLRSVIIGRIDQSYNLSVYAVCEAVRVLDMRDDLKPGDYREFVATLDACAKLETAAQ